MDSVGTVVAKLIAEAESVGRKAGHTGRNPPTFPMVSLGAVPRVVCQCFGVNKDCKRKMGT